MARPDLAPPLSPHMLDLCTVMFASLPCTLRVYFSFSKHFPKYTMIVHQYATDNMSVCIIWTQLQPCITSNKTKGTFNRFSKHAIGQLCGGQTYFRTYFWNAPFSYLVCHKVLCLLWLWTRSDRVSNRTTWKLCKQDARPWRSITRNLTTQCS